MIIFQDSWPNDLELQPHSNYFIHYEEREWVNCERKNTLKFQLMDIDFPFQKYAIICKETTDKYFLSSQFAISN